MNLDTSQAISYAARTDVGKIREHNEDCYCVNTDLGLFVVADGMGGHASGEVASEIAVSTIEQQVLQGSSLVEAIEQAHIAILKGVETGRGKSGMGTTVVAVQLHNNNYTLAWVGDSRAYLWDEGISRLSKDHSMVQMLLDSGQITQAEARTHPRKNIIYQNLGAAEVKVPDVSIKQGVLYKNQMIVLCSDGLSDEVDDDQMSYIISQADGAEETAERLVDAAIDNGGKDNVSVIVIAASGDALEKPTLDPSSDEVSKDTLIPDD
jgi:PPM family protein phosphatase